MSNLPKNAFLRTLAPETLRTLLPQLARVELELGQVLYRPDDRIDWIYFPESCLLSVLTAARDGDTVETAMVGTEGAMLVLEACASGVSAATCLAQVDGAAWRIPASLCRSLMAEDRSFAEQSLRLIELQTLESRQSGLCQALHTVEPRMARWLLESSERSAGRNPMPLTQDFVAAMLGVQRTTVTAFAFQLQKAGLIRYSRGRVELLDVEGLEARACECRDATREHRRQAGLEPIVSDRPKLRVVQG